MALNILVWGNVSLRAQEFMMSEPFSNEGSVYQHFRTKKTNISQPIIIVDGSVSEYREIQADRSTYNRNSERTVSSEIVRETRIHFQKSSELFSDLGSYGTSLESTDISEPPSSVMMRGPGGNPGGVVDDPIGSAHILVLFVLIYGFYVYKRNHKRIKE